MSEVLIDRDAGVTTVTLNRLAAKNALTSSMYAALADALAAAAHDASQRVLVIQGHEAVFTAGNDIGDFLNAPPGAAADAPVHRFLNAIATFPKPLVAAVCGPAVGVGTTMLLHSDLVVAGDNAIFALPFVNLGVCPEAASSLLLARLIGHQRAAQALMLGDPMSAQTALELGLVNQLVVPGEANAAAQSLARRLAAKPLQSLLATKALMKAPLQAQILSAMADEGERFAQLLQQPAAKEAFAAFFQKRKPDFSAC